MDDVFGLREAAIELPDDRWLAIAALVEQLVDAGKVESKDYAAVLEAVTVREKAMTTGIGRGFAIPHATTPLVREVVGALGFSRNGIPWDALDGEPVRGVILFLVPKGEFQRHINVLANISKYMGGQHLGPE